MLAMVLGGSTMSRTQGQLWYKRLQKDGEDVNDDACPVHPGTSTTDENIEAVKKTILENRRITISEVADNVDILFGSWQANCTDV